MKRALSLGILIGLSGLLGACDDETPAGGGDEDVTVDGGQNGDISTDGLFQPGEDGGEDATTSDTPVLDDAVIQDDATQDDTTTEDDTNSGETLGRDEECGFDTAPCDDGLQCLGTCQLPCGEGCPDGEDCIDPGGMGFGVCGHIAGEGEDCNFQTADVCDEGLFCNEGTCEAAETAGEGEECGGFNGADCGEGLTCVGSGGGGGFCQPMCEGGDGCDDGEICVVSTNGDGACFEDCDPDSDPECADENMTCRLPLSGGEDEACLPRFGDPPGDTPFGSACDDENRCMEGFFCPGFDGSYCTQTCEVPEDCPEEPAGAECVGFGMGGGVCTFTCPEGTDEECPEGMSCTDFFGQMVCQH